MRARFGEFVLDSGARSLERDGAPLPLTRKAFELLELLLLERPRVVPKEELLARVWPDAIVTADNLKNLVAKIRKALGRQGARSANRLTITARSEESSGWTMR